MWEKVRKEEERNRKDHTLFILLFLCAVLMAIVVIVWGQAFLRHMRYRSFVSDFSECTTYAYNNKHADAIVNGENVFVTRVNVYKIYNYISLNGMGREAKELPAEDAAVIIDYGNGSRLSLWEVETPYEAESSFESVNPKSLLVCFDRGDGKPYAYTSDKMDLETFIIRYLSF